MQAKNFVNILLVPVERKKGREERQSKITSKNEN